MTSASTANAGELVTDFAVQTGATVKSGRAKQFLADNAGLFLVVLSQAFSSLMNLSVKLLNNVDPPVSVLEVILVRMVITYICCLAYMLWTRMENPIVGPKGLRLLLAVRGITGFVGLFGGYFSLQYLSLSDATILVYISPLCTVLASAVFLKEKLHHSQAIAGGVSLVGVILIARPPFLFGGAPSLIPDAQRMIGVVSALVGVFGIVGGYVTVRGMGKRVHPVQVLAHYAIYCIFVAIIGMIVTKTPFVIPSRLDWFAILLLIGVFGFVAQILLTMGFQRETAGRASLALYTQIVFANILQVIVFHKAPPVFSVIGTCLILSAAIYVAVTKEKKTNEHTKNPINLRAEEYDHLEAALLHASEADTDNASETSCPKEDERDR
ncbi:hypothetical protein M378DRAFT_15176 [Amanita muscaria Koide BX008]|uniref:EamA domain-containing protein n=1 Tax=Amanita muscaria (strain Koide BX008) TaxID=946122 RepID=A0A0C2WC78_AMAMK|nr:hypothetical protein M378DRAFT_15176 [Amanita muscaria Koide BX008]